MPAPTMDRFDLVIRGGTVYDGSGAPGAIADVAVRGDRIAAVGAVAGRGGVEIEAPGLAVAPGFIDVHSHDDFAVLLDPEMSFKVMQGVTTDVVGNCGSGVVPYETARARFGRLSPGARRLRGPDSPATSRAWTRPIPVSTWRCSWATARCARAPWGSTSAADAR